jgi:hypothetical protein
MYWHRPVEDTPSSFFENGDFRLTEFEWGLIALA